MPHDDDAVAERHGLRLIVGDVDRGDAERAQQAVELAAQPLAQRGIERGQRLIEQQHPRPWRDRARQSHALALPARELIDFPLLQSFDPGKRDEFLNPRIALRSAQSADFQAVADVVGDVHVGKQRIGLEHHADVAPLDRDLGHVLAVEAHAPARIGRLQSGDDAQRRRLAATGRAEEHQGLAARDLKRHRLERAGAVGKRLRAGFEPHRHARTHAALRGPRPSICMATSSGMIMMKKISV